MDQILICLLMTETELVRTLQVLVVVELHLHSLVAHFVLRAADFTGDCLRSNLVQLGHSWQVVLCRWRIFA